MLLLSLGLYVVIQNVISITFGDDLKTLDASAATAGVDLFGARITPFQILIICLAACVVAASLFLKRSRFGLSICAIANSRELASGVGVNLDRVTLYASAIAAGLAGLAGILVAKDVGMSPTMGLHPLLMAVVAVIIGGEGLRIWGIVGGALLLGFAQNVGVWKIPTQWQDAITFIILLVFLVAKHARFQAHMSITHKS